MYARWQQRMNTEDLVASTKKIQEEDLKSRLLVDLKCLLQTHFGDISYNVFDMKISFTFKEETLNTCNPED